MDAATRNQVRVRALHRCEYHRCEYCRLPQSAAPYLMFHVKHIQAPQHVSDDSLDNLALACPDCNRHKGPNLTTLDPQTRNIVPLFHPRQDIWEEHFKYHGALLVGLSLMGKVTVTLLQMNADERVEMREELQAGGEM